MAMLYFTINDTITTKTLESISSVTTAHKNESPIIVGGMAVQFHCKDSPDFLRPTSDVDIMYTPQIPNYNSFNTGIGGTLMSFLKNSGYQVQLKKVKDRTLYEVKIMNGQGAKAKELFFIHFDQISPDKISNAPHIIDRETANALEEEYIGKKLYIQRIEDIIPHKIKRIRKNMKITNDSSSLEKSLYEAAESGIWNNLANVPFQSWANLITEEQNSLSKENSPRRVKYVINKDLYDVCLLAHKIESNPSVFNKAYFLQSKSELDSF